MLYPRKKHILNELKQLHCFNHNKNKEVEIFMGFSFQRPIQGS